MIFLDADDYLYPQTARRVVAGWLPGISKIQYRLDLVDGTGRKIDIFPAREVTFDSGDVVPHLLSRGRYQTVVTSGNAFSRRALAEILPMPEQAFRLCADGYLVAIAPFHGPVVSLEEPLGAYRRHGANGWGDTAGPLAERLRRSLAHDGHRYRALSAKARLMRFSVAASLGMRDHEHLETRLASLCLDPRISIPTCPTPGRGWPFAARSKDAWTRPCPWKRESRPRRLVPGGGLPPPTPRGGRRFLAPGPVSRPRHVARFARAIRRVAEARLKPTGSAPAAP